MLLELMLLLLLLLLLELSLWLGLLLLLLLLLELLLCSVRYRPLKLPVVVFDHDTPLHHETGARQQEHLALVLESRELRDVHPKDIDAEQSPVPVSQERLGLRFPCCGRAEGPPSEHLALQLVVLLVQVRTHPTVYLYSHQWQLVKALEKQF